MLRDGQPREPAPRALAVDSGVTAPLRIRMPSPGTMTIGALLLLIILYNVIWAFPTTQFLPDRIGLNHALLRRVYERETPWRALPLRDFGSFVAAGQLAAAGQNPYGDHPLVFRPYFQGDPEQVTSSPNLNPPLSVMAFQLLASVNPSTAYRIWYGVSLGLFILALLVLRWTFPDTATPLRLLWALSLAGLWHVVELGQIYLPLLLATVGAWLLLRVGRQAPAGLLIGLVVAIKPTFALWPLLLLLSGGWIAGAVAVAVAALVSLVPVLVYGPVIYSQWLDATARFSEALLVVPGNSSLVALAARLGVPWLGYVVAGALVVVIAVWVWRRRPPLLVVSTIALIVSMLAAPLTWAGYTVLLLPALLSRPWSRAIRVVAVLLVVPILAVIQFSITLPSTAIAVGGLYGWSLLILLGVYWGESRSAARQPEHAPDGLLASTA